MAQPFGSAHITYHFVLDRTSELCDGAHGQGDRDTDRPKAVYNYQDMVGWRHVKGKIYLFHPNSLPLRANCSIE
jgi:hypothetical protein